MTVLTTFANNAFNNIKKFPPVLKKDWWVFLCTAAYFVFADKFLDTACFIKSSIGIPCPGCGMTRAAFALVHGNLRMSLYYHPLLLPAVVILGVYFIAWLGFNRSPRKLLIALGVALAAVYAARMAFMFPHTAPLDFNMHSIVGRIFGSIIGGFFYF